MADAISAADRRSDWRRRRPRRPRRPLVRKNAECWLNSFPLLQWANSMGRAATLFSPRTSGEMFRRRDVPFLWRLRPNTRNFPALLPSGREFRHLAIGFRLSRQYEARSEFTVRAEAFPAAGIRAMGP